MLFVYIMREFLIKTLEALKLHRFCNIRVAANTGLLIKITYMLQDITEIRLN
jgi:hypothetical protein